MTHRRLGLAAILIAVVLLVGGGPVLGAQGIALVVDGRTIPCDTPPQNVGGHVLVPIRAVSEALGCDVSWDQTGQRVLVATAGGSGTAAGGAAGGGLKVIDASSVYAAASPSVVAILCYGTDTGTADEIIAWGSGFVYSAEGLIVTNHHVVNGAARLKVVFPDGRAYDVGAEVVSDELTDIAVLDLHVSGLTPLRLGDSDKVRVGEPVIAIGNPVEMQLRNTVTAGIVSGTGREVEDWYSVIQTDAAINQGNSGGPLLNAAGEVIGVTNSKLVNETIEGLAFAIPSNTVKDIVTELLADGHVSRPWLGVNLQESLEAQFGLPTDEGLVVVSVIPGGPAEPAGVKAGDEITAADGQPVHSMWDLTLVLRSHEVGDTLTLTVRRAGTLKDLVVTLRERP